MSAGASPPVSTPPSGDRRAQTRGEQRTSSLSSYLFFILVVAFLPLLAFAFISLALFADEQREIFQRGATERTRALLTAVDTELKRSVAALEALGTSSHLDGGNLGEFGLDAQRVLRSRDEWLNIHLAPPTGDQIVNLLRPPEVPFHHVIDEATFQKVVRTRRPVVGNLFLEPFSRRHVFPVRVPILRDGEVRYVLSALVKPEAIGALLSSQELPSDWVGTVLDAKRAIVARTVAAERVGEPASESLRAALDRAPDGWFEGATLEGWPVFTPFNRSTFSGWTVAIGIPKAAVEASLERSLAALGALVAALLGSGLALAWLLSRRSTRSLADLARRAKALGRTQGAAPPEPPAAASSGISEIEDLRLAFANAAALIRARSEERDRVEASLRRAQAKLRVVDERKDRFLAVLGHELRNPLGVVASAVRLLDESADDDEARGDAAKMIERQVKQMSTLLDDLLDVSRIAEGRIRLTRKPCDLGEVVRSVTEDHRELLERAGLDLELQVSERSIWVLADEARLVQAVDNVLRNAIKYSDRGGKVRVAVGEAEGGRAVVTVRDTGVGMEPGVLAHVFEPFSQAEGTLARSDGGLGLGLALVKGLVELHGGGVRVASEGVGMGTEVVIELPVVRSP